MKHSDTPDVPLCDCNKCPIKEACEIYKNEHKETMREQGWITELCPLKFVISNCLEKLKKQQNAKKV